MADRTQYEHISGFWSVHGTRIVFVDKSHIDERTCNIDKLITHGTKPSLHIDDLVKRQAYLELGAGKPEKYFT